MELILNFRSPKFNIRHICNFIYLSCICVYLYGLLFLLYLYFNILLTYYTFDLVKLKFL